MLYDEQPQTQWFALTNVFLTHRSVGWWWFCWAHLGLLTLDFTLVWNSDLSHVVTAPSLGISCYLVCFPLLIMERHASNPAHKIKPMVLTWAFETLCILTISFRPPTPIIFSLFKSNRFLSPIIHDPCVAISLFCCLHSSIKISHTLLPYPK